MPPGPKHPLEFTQTLVQVFEIPYPKSHRHRIKSTILKRKVFGIGLFKTNPGP